MKIVIKSDEGKRFKLYLPLIAPPASITRKILTQNVDYDVMPSKKELNALMKGAIKILKEHKGLNLVETESEDGDSVKITI